MSDLIGTKEIASLFDLTREYVTDKVVRRADFPKPKLKLNRKTRKWSAEEVEAWRKKTAAM